MAKHCDWKGEGSICDTGSIYTAPLFVDEPLFKGQVYVQGCRIHLNRFVMATLLTDIQQMEREESLGQHRFDEGIVPFIGGTQS